MRHEKIRKLLGAFLDKELDAEYIKAVENHLNICPKCREELTFLKKMEELSGKTLSIPQEEKYWTSFPSRVKNSIKQIINEGRMK